MKAGALTESARHEELATKRTPVFERPVIDTVLDAPVPWLLTLIPVGSLGGRPAHCDAGLARDAHAHAERTEHRGGSRPQSADHGRSGMRRVGLASWTGVHALGALGGSAGAGPASRAGPRLSARCATHWASSSRRTVGGTRKPLTLRSVRPVLERARGTFDGCRSQARMGLGCSRSGGVGGTHVEDPRPG